MRTNALKHQLHFGGTGDVVPAPSWCIYSGISRLRATTLGRDALRAAPLQQVHSTCEATSGTDFQI